MPTFEQIQYNVSKVRYWNEIKEKVNEKIMLENKEIITYYFDMGATSIDPIFVLSNPDELKKMKEKLKRRKQ